VKGNFMLYLISPPMTLLCKQVPGFHDFKHSDWISAVTITGKQIFVAKRNISMIEEVSDEKLKKVQDAAKDKKLVTPLIPGGRVS